jgi:hypothetical protein
MATAGFGAPVVLTDTAAEILASGANELVIITKLTARNTDTETRVVTLYQVPDGDAADATTEVLAQTVYAGQTANIDFAAAMLNNGGALWAKADVTSVVNLSANYFKSDQLG